MIEDTNRIELIKIYLKQINGFYKEIEKLAYFFDGEYDEELIELVDETDRLRTKFSILYAKMNDGDSDE